MGQIIWAIASLVTLISAGTLGHTVAAVVGHFAGVLNLDALNIGNWIGYFAGFSAILVFGLLMFETMNLFAVPWGVKKPGAVLLYWGRDVLQVGGVALLLLAIIGYFDLVSGALCAFGWIALELTTREQAAQEEAESYWEKDWLQVNRVKAAWEVRRAQWWYGIRGAQTWGTYRLSELEARFHRLIIGEPGSGKTLYLTHQVLPPLLTRVASGTPSWLVIQDYKNDFLGEIEAVGAPCFRLNPVDPQATAIDLSQEVTNFAKCFEIADLLVQGTQDKSDFFSTSARDLIASVMYSFVLLVQRGEITSWSLRWVILAFDNPRALEKLFKRNPETADTLRVLLDKPQNNNNTRFQLSPAGRDVFATVRSTLFRLAPLAALWDAAPRQASIAEMLASSSVLHLGFDSRYALLCKRCHQIALSLLHDHIMATGNEGAPVDFIFEEAAALAPIPHLQDLLKVGRGKGVSVTTMLQSPTDFIGEYRRAGHPEEEPRGILELSGQLKAVFRCSDETARWAAEHLFGDREYLGTTYTESSSVSRGVSSSSTSTSRALARRNGVVPRDLKDLPKPHPSEGHCGFFEVRPSKNDYNPHGGWHFWQVSWDQLNRRRDENTAVVDYQPVPDRSTRFTLRPLDQAEKDQIFGPQ